MTLKYKYIVCLTIVLVSAIVCRAEFQVNTRTSDNQADPDIAMDANGNFVVVWSSYRQDGDSGGIFGQRFDCDGTPIGVEFQVNSETTGNQTKPSVAMDAKGNFSVVWHGPGPDEEDIFAQRFDANSQTIGSEFRVDTNTFSRQLHPEIAMNNTGRFVIVWESEVLGGVPTEAWSICCQIYDSNGQAIGNEHEINLLTQCRYPDVGIDDNGNFTVVWMQDDDYHTSNIILARQYNADGTPQADPYQVSTTEFFYTSHPSIAADASGHFVVVWDGNPDSASQDNILGRRYKFDGTPLTDEFIVNTTTIGTQERPDVAINNYRRFVIVWNSEPEPNSNIRDIIGRRYDESANPVGDEFKINTYEFNDQKYPSAAMKENGEFITVWQSSGQDGSDWGVFGQIGPMIGCADFSGDLFVNFYDFRVLADHWLEDNNSMKTDLIDDNKIDGLDLQALCEQWLIPCYDCNDVDINGDKKIDFKDYALWSAHWLKQGPLAADLTGEGTVDMADLKAVVLHWAKTCQ